MRRSRSLAVVALVFAACHNTTFKYPEESEVLASPEKSMAGMDIPNAPPVRDAWTKYLAVKDGGKVIGYVVRYDEPPVGAYTPGRAPTGTLLVEDGAFQRIGFVTHAGKGFRYRGSEPEELGVATIEQHLAAFFGKKGLTLEPLTK